MFYDADKVILSGGSGNKAGYFIWTLFNKCIVLLFCLRYNFLYMLRLINQVSLQVYLFDLSSMFIVN